MATYILLLTLTPEGRVRMAEDPESLGRAARSSQVPGVEWLGLYAVLGRYDFVTIVSAPGNEAAARYSLELGVEAGAHIETLPAVPIGLLEGEAYEPEPGERTGATPPG